MSPQIFVCLQTNFTCIGKNSPAKHQWCMNKKLLGGLTVVSLFFNKNNMNSFLNFEVKEKIPVFSVCLSALITFFQVFDRNSVF
jgi:hypothetical protein